MAGTNGKPVTMPEQQSSEREPYRPTASTQKVYDTVVRSLANVVSASTFEAYEFINLFEHYDRDATTAVRYGHLVDAAECLEIALTHLGQLKSAVSHRLLIEDEQNTGTPGF
jgi:hypothetical protein